MVIRSRAATVPTMPGPDERWGPWRALLAQPGVDEVCVLRSRFGFMAIHGGNLERVTDVVAIEAADRSGASCYAVIQQPPRRDHVASSLFDPSESDTLAAFLDHVDVVVALHGYGRESLFTHLLLGGTNRPLARHVAAHLRGSLPDRYTVIDELEQVPEGLRGLHPDNPVNRVPGGGVQIELPPTIRWSREASNWSDHDGTPRTEDVSVLIDALAAAASSWPPAP
jgi:phage replication-related protein YjqB (UPF0714/DUF867 family)